MQANNEEFMQRMNAVDSKTRAYARFFDFKAQILEPEYLYQQAMLKLYERFCIEPDFLNNTNSYIWCYAAWMMKNYLNHEVGIIEYELDVKAGLIQLLFTQGDLDKALEEIELLYPDLENCNITTHEGDWIYTLAYKVLKACGDSRADILLQKAYDLFLKISEKFEDEELGKSYLENVQAHREILQEWRARQKT